ncbi:hypothetical protein FNF29_03011 [Cafeteria roenbergensis]|uniref:Uncharacterized protein n=1 Tax=Cafeteria roenbergensis TaxID=33653 RepID=A0A5A8CKJ0_CAFRO|nr:hypothetical protein FNF29_03011 [Cafeteria roenbergensis]|eukprot:KAA0153623.1 hypothetical protein FNF29_03011 [Cafeteria roenbergensis]
MADLLAEGLPVPTLTVDAAAPDRVADAVSLEHGQAILAGSCGLWQAACLEQERNARDSDLESNLDDARSSSDAASDGAEAQEDRVDDDFDSHGHDTDASGSEAGDEGSELHAVLAALSADLRNALEEGKQASSQARRAPELGGSRIGEGVASDSDGDFAVAADDSQDSGDSDSDSDASSWSTDGPDHASSH